MHEKLIERKPVLRENFGPGESGEMAFKIIASGAICEAEPSDSNKCENISDRTVGFDIGSAYDLLPVCSDEHEKLIQMQLKQDLIKSGRAASFDRNGFGRN